MGQAPADDRHGGASEPASCEAEAKGKEAVSRRLGDGRWSSGPGGAGGSGSGLGDGLESASGLLEAKADHEEGGPGHGDQQAFDAGEGGDAAGFPLPPRGLVRAEAGLDPEARRQLKRTGAVEAEGLALGVGARLRREWKGKLVDVDVKRVLKRARASRDRIAATGVGWKPSDLLNGRGI